MYQRLRELISILNRDYNHGVYAIFIDGVTHDRVVEELRQSGDFVKIRDQLYLCGVRVINGISFFTEGDWLAVGYGLIPLAKGRFEHGS